MQNMQSGKLKTKLNHTQIKKMNFACCFLIYSDDRYNSPAHEMLYILVFGQDKII